MLALRLYGPNDVRLDEVPVPQIKDGEILLKTEAAAICGTDVRMWKNGATGVDGHHPLTLGHEFSGEIVEVGKNVAFYKKGMKVSMQPNIGCGVCDRCVAGNFHLCDHYRAFGINMDGAFAEYVRIPEEAVTRSNLSLRPAGVTAAEAAIVEPFSCAYNGFLKCRVSPGEMALVVGAGPIGIMHTQLLHMAGAKVLMNDISKDRLEFCKTLMPYITVYSGNDLEGFVREWTGGVGLDVAVTACPVPSVQAAVLPLMNYGGRVNFFGGIPADKQPVQINTNLIHYHELYVTGSTRSSIAQYRKVLDFVSKGLIDAKSLITDRYKLSDAMTALDRAASAVGVKHVFCFE